MSSAIAAGYKRGISDDHRRQRRHPADRLHPLRPGDRRGQGLRLHPRRRHDRLAADRGRLHPGAARQHEPLAAAALAERARRRRRGQALALRLHGREPLVLLDLRRDPDRSAALALATKQLNFGIDFESGTRITVALEQPTDEEGGARRPRRSRDQRRGDPAGQRPELRRQRLPDPVARARAGRSPRGARRRWPSEFGIAEDGFDSTSVGPTFGQQVADSALKALIFSLLVICGYVALRFDPKFAVPVLIAIFHDILITAGVYSLTGKEVSSGTVAAFLTILGYSIYDTIIVFDRIRENVPRMPRAAFSQIVNRSMSEVLTRSLATSFSTLLGGRRRCWSSAARRCRTSPSRCWSGSPPVPTRRSSSPRRC